MSLEEINLEHEHTIRVVLADAARAAVKTLEGIDPFDAHMMSWYMNRLNDYHAAYRAVTGVPMEMIHREGTTFVPAIERNAR